MGTNNSNANQYVTWMDAAQLGSYTATTGTLTTTSMGPLQPGQAIPIASRGQVGNVPIINNDFTQEEVTILRMMIHKIRERMAISIKTESLEQAVDEAVKELL